MLINPDFSEAVESEAIPAGVYKARITEVTPKKSKAGGDYLSWKMVIFGAEGDAAKQNNRPFFHTTMLAGPGAGMLKTLAKAALGELPQPFDTDLLIGKEVEVTLADNIIPATGEKSAWPSVKAVKSVN